MFFRYVPINCNGVESITIETFEGSELISFELHGITEAFTTITTEQARTLSKYLLEACETIGENH